MAIEIERKFLVCGDGWRIGATGVRIVQGYLNSQGSPTVRVRIAGEQGWLTIKGPKTGISCEEFEYPIPLADAEAMLRLCRPGTIAKTRYLVAHAGWCWEVDEFANENSGLVIAEIELRSDADDPPLPEWVGDEVSGDFRFTNSSLGLRPFSTWNKPVGRQSR